MTNCFHLIPLECMQEQKTLYAWNHIKQCFPCMNCLGSFLCETIQVTYSNESQRINMSIVEHIWSKGPTFAIVHQTNNIPSFFPQKLIFPTFGENVANALCYLCMWSYRIFSNFDFALQQYSFQCLMWKMSRPQNIDIHTRQVMPQKNTHMYTLGP